MFKKCFCFFEHEGVPYDLKVLKIIKHNKKIFNLSYWTGLYDQNCRIYPPFYIFRYTGPMVTRYTGGLSQLPVVEMSWGKKSKKKPCILNNFCFLVNLIRHTGPMVTMVTRYTGTQAGYLSFQWSKWAGKKNLRKNQVFLPTFIFWSISSDTLVPWSPWSPQVTRYTGGLSQLPVVEMSWEKKSKKKSSVLTNFCFLVNFIRHTSI